MIMLTKILESSATESVEIQLVSETHYYCSHSTHLLFQSATTCALSLSRVCVSHVHYLSLEYTHMRVT